MRRDSSVLFVSGTLEVGGSETKIVKLANALSQSGHTVGIAYLNAPDTLLERVNPEVPVTYLDRHGKYSFRSLRKLNELIDRKFRVVVSVNFYPLLYAVPAVRYFSHGRAKVISLINTTDFEGGQWVFGPIYAPFIRRCDSVVFGCEAQKEVWIRKYRLPADRSLSIYNGVDSEFYSPAAMPDAHRQFRQDFHIPQDAIVIGGIGRFAPEKHFKLLIEALDRLQSMGRDVYLILVGQGEEAPQLEQAAWQHDVFDKIRFTGELSDVRPALAAMDIFVLPSRAVETFSNAALEAMAMQRPVILSDIGGAAEMIEDEVSGLLFEVGDIEQLTDQLAKLVDISELRSLLGLAARQRVVDQFTFPNMVDEYEKLLFS